MNKVQYFINKNKFLEILYEIATIIDTQIRLDVAEDPNDNMLIECAVEANADYIISGDEHLTKLKQFRGIRIVSVNDFLLMEEN